MKFLMILILCFPVMAFSEDDIAPPDGAAIVDSESGTSETPDSDIDTGEGDQAIGDTSNAFQGIQNGAAIGAIKGAKRAADTAMVGAAVTIGFTAACAASLGTASFSCSAAVIAAGGTMALYTKARKLNNHARQFLTGDNDYGLADDDAFIDQQIAVAQGQLAELESQGFVSNGDGTVTTPDGRTLSSADFESASSLQRAGASPADANKILEEFKGIQANAESKSRDQLRSQLAESTSGAGGVAGAGSAGFSGGRKLGGASDDGETGDGAAPAPIAQRLTASEANGYNTSFLGTRIGIAGASVFGIVTKRYQKNDKRNSFFKREY